MSNQASRCRFPQRGAGAVHASLMAEGPIFRWAYALQAKSTRRAGKRTLGMAIPLLTSGWGLASGYQKRRAHFLSLALGGRATRASTSGASRRQEPPWVGVRPLSAARALIGNTDMCEHEIQQYIRCVLTGAPGRTRTSTPLRATDFESAASTTSATGAAAPILGGPACRSSCARPRRGRRTPGPARDRCRAGSSRACRRSRRRGDRPPRAGCRSRSTCAGCGR
jgi:hypothetical protein